MSQSGFKRTVPLVDPVVKIVAWAFGSLAVILMIHLFAGLYRNHQLLTKGETLWGRVTESNPVGVGGAILQVTTDDGARTYELHWSSLGFKRLYVPGVNDYVLMLDVPGRPGLRTAKTFSQIWGTLVVDLVLVLTLLIPMLYLYRLDKKSGKLPRKKKA